jgi:ABC-type dipeptide/oligopeptide/nickel transport system permease component
MTGYLLRRVGQAVIVIIGVVLITFLLAKLIPGG